MPEALITPPNFPNDSSVHLGATFETWRTSHVGVDMQSLAPLKEVYVNSDTLKRLMDRPNCAGVVFYSAVIDIDDPDNPGQKKKLATLVAVGVDDSGNLLNGQDGPFYIAAPCPPYCPSWG